MVAIVETTGAFKDGVPGFCMVDGMLLFMVVGEVFRILRSLMDDNLSI